MDDTQIRVATGMGLAMATAVAAFGVAAVFAPRVWAIEPSLAFRLTLAAWSALGPALMLCVCIARLAKHRFFTPADINGSGLTHGTDKARLLQALLQNTLEQACLAVPVFFTTAVVAPLLVLPLVPTAALLFVVGRIAFFAGYAEGAPSRAFGFALTFYPTVLLIVILGGFAAMKAVT